MYCQAFRVNFQLNFPSDIPSSMYLLSISLYFFAVKSLKVFFFVATITVPEVSDSVLIRVCELYRPSPEWKHDNFMVAVQIYHGTRHVGHPVLSQPSALTTISLYPKVVFNCW